MSTKTKSIVAKILIAAMLCMAVLGIAACGDTDTTPAPEVTGVTLTAAAGATRGETENEHILSYKVTEGSDVSVTVQKDGAAASSAEYTYTAATKTVVFHAEGTFTVTVHAELNGKSDEGSVSITVGELPFTAVADGDPVIYMKVNGSYENAVTVDEGSTVTLKTNVAYDPADTKISEDFDVLVFDGKKFDIVTENAEMYYQWVGSGFTAFRPLVPGLFQIRMTVESQNGGAQKTVGVECTAAHLQLELSSAVPRVNGRVRLLKDTQSSLAYSVSNGTGGVAYLDHYEVSAAVDNQNVAVSVDADSQTLTVSAEQNSTATVTVTYTHTKVANRRYSLEVPVAFVTDLAHAPAFGADPFGGTYGTLIPSTGLVLYFDATTASGEPLTYADITYEVVESDLTRAKNTAAQSTLAAKIYDNVRDNTNYPYLIVEDFENNTSSGTVTVRITATSEGCVAVAEKVFTVQPLASNVAGSYTSAAGISDYLANVYDLGAINYDEILSVNHRQNMVVGKEGLLVNRAWGSGNIFNVDVYKIDNFRIDFTYAILARMDIEGHKNIASFNMCFRTGAFDGYCGSQTAFYAEDTSEDIVAGYWGGNASWSKDLPGAQLGKTYHIRLTHTVTGGTVRFVYEWSDDGETYHDWLSYNVGVSSANADLGAPVYAIQFNHEGGSFLLGGVMLTEL